MQSQRALSFVIRRGLLMPGSREKVSGGWRALFLQKGSLLCVASTCSLLAIGTHLKCASYSRPSQEVILPLTARHTFTGYSLGHSLVAVLGQQPLQLLGTDAML